MNIVPTNSIDSGIVTWKTTDYSIFKKLKCNRPVGDSVRPIQESIKTVGLVPVPIVINENMEVIDGQNRIEACQREGVEVYFQIHPGLGIKECRYLNTGQSNWKLSQYLNSYVEDNFENYIWLDKMYKRYPGIRLGYIASLSCTGTTTTSSKSSSVVKSGQFFADSQRRQFVEDFLKFANPFAVPLQNETKGRFMYFWDALLFCFTNDKIDAKKVADILLKNSSLIHNQATKDDYIIEIDRVYNHKCKKEDKQPINAIWVQLKFEAGL